MKDHDPHHAHADHVHAEHGSSALPEIVTRVRALEDLLVEKGVVERAALDRIVEAYETQIGPRKGALVVARDWSAPAYKRRLPEAATAAIAP